MSVKSWLVSLEFFGSHLWKYIRVVSYLQFVLPMRSVNFFSFIHRMTLSIARSYRKFIVASKSGVSGDLNVIRKQFRSSTVSGLELAFKTMNVQFRPGFAKDLTSTAGVPPPPPRPPNVYFACLCLACTHAQTCWREFMYRYSQHRASLHVYLKKIDLACDNKSDRIEVNWMMAACKVSSPIIADSNPVALFGETDRRLVNRKPTQKHQFLWTLFTRVLFKFMLYVKDDQPLNRMNLVVVVVFFFFFLSPLIMFKMEISQHE